MTEEMEVSPYVAAAADRLGIGKGNNVVKLSQTIRPASTYIGSKAAYPHSARCFARQQSQPSVIGPYEQIPWETYTLIDPLGVYSRRKHWLEWAAIIIGTCAIAGAGWAMWG